MSSIAIHHFGASLFLEPKHQMFHSWKNAKQNAQTFFLSLDSFPKPKKIASVDARWKLNPCLMHSFGITKHYLILPEQPLTLDVKAMVANTVKDKPFIETMEWIQDKLVSIGRFFYLYNFHYTYSLY